MTLSKGSGPAGVKVFDPEVFARGVPHEALRTLRDRAPVSWQDEPAVRDWPSGPGFWAVTRHADVKHVLRTPEIFSSSLGATQIRDPEPGDLAFIRRMILNMDAPEHNRLRKVVAERARALIGAVAPAGECDLPVEVTDDFPLLNLADLLGVPAEDRGLLLRWTNRVIGYQDPEHADDVVRDAAGTP